MKSPYSQYSQNPKFNQPLGQSEFDYDVTGGQWFNQNHGQKPNGHAASTSVGNYSQPPQWKPQNSAAQHYKQKMASKYGNESFDVEFMMPPDIMSIDSDISK